MKSSEFQSRSELLVIENCLPLTDEVQAKPRTGQIPYLGLDIMKN